MSSRLENSMLLPEKHARAVRWRWILAAIVVALVATHLASAAIGMAGQRWLDARTAKFAAEQPKTTRPAPTAVDIFENENCVEMARACFARKRMERVKGKQG